MANRQFQLTEQEIGQLRRAEGATRDTRELKRLQGVRMYGTGKSLSSIQELVGCSESSLREWVYKYQQGGVVALATGYHKSARNASKLSTTQQADLRERLHTYRPDQVLAGAGQFWTVRDLQTVVEQWYGVMYQDEGSYRNLFHRCGFSYQRAEKVYKSRPSEVDLAAFAAELEKK
jgi:transposase